MPRFPRVTSRQHDLVQRFRRVAARREKGPVVLLDGEHLIVEALDAGLAVEVVVALTERPLLDRAQRAGAAVYLGSAQVIEAMSPVKEPGGLVALARWEPVPLARAFEGDVPLVLGLVDVQDPGNLGSAIRAAAALGATGAVAIGESADPGGWRALRGAMGSTFRVPVARGSAADVLAEARRRGLRIATTTAGAGTPITKADLTGPLLILLGNEGAGLPRSLEAEAALTLTAPMDRGVESLNVAVTAALVLFEARRQRSGERP